MLAEYRATPIPSLGYSPSEILMGRLVRTKVLVNNENLKPISNLGSLHEDLKRKMIEKQDKTKIYFDKKCKIEKPFAEKENVFVRERDKWVEGQVVNQTKYPRSYNVILQNGSVVRRNTMHLKHTIIMFRPNSCDDYDDFLDRKTLSVQNHSNVQIFDVPCNRNLDVPCNSDNLTIRDVVASSSESNEILENELSIIPNHIRSSPNVNDTESANTSFESVASEPPIGHDHDYTLLDAENPVGRPKRRTNKPLRLFDYEKSFD